MLPINIIIDIIKSCDPHSYFSLVMTCKLFKEITEENLDTPLVLVCLENKNGIQFIWLNMICYIIYSNSKLKDVKITKIDDRNTIQIMRKYGYEHYKNFELVDNNDIASSDFKNLPMKIFLEGFKQYHEHSENDLNVLFYLILESPKDILKYIDFNCSSSIDDFLDKYSDTESGDIEDEVVLDSIKYAIENFKRYELKDNLSVMKEYSYRYQHLI